MYSVNTILHPTDFSDYSKNAFELASGMSAQHGARVIVLHVAPLAPTVAPMPYDVAAAHAEEFSDEKLLAQLEELRYAKPTLTMDYVLERGNPNEVILRVAKEAECDAIVMGTHGRTGLTRLLMGSVAEHVMRGAHCPVITVREPIPDASKSAQVTETSASANA